MDQERPLRRDVYPQAVELVKIGVALGHPDDGNVRRDHLVFVIGPGRARRQPNFLHSR